MATVKEEFEVFAEKARDFQMKLLQPIRVHWVPWVWGVLVLLLSLSFAVVSFTIKYCWRS